MLKSVLRTLMLDIFTNVFLNATPLYDLEGVMVIFKPAMELLASKMPIGRSITSF